MNYQRPKVHIRGKSVDVSGTDGSKAAIARVLFMDPAGYTVTEVSKAVPMNYSQAHTIKKKMNGAATTKPNRSLARASKDWGDLVDPKPKTKKPKPSPVLTRKVLTAARTGTVPKVSPRVGKLRTPGLPSDIDVGPCHNCGFDLVIRKSAHGLIFTHVNTTTEEYLSTTQFCQAVPEVLVPRS